MGIEIPVAGLIIQSVQLAAVFLLVFSLVRIIQLATNAADVNLTVEANVAKKDKKTRFWKRVGGFMAAMILISMFMSATTPKLALQSQQPSVFDRPEVSTVITEGNKAPEFLKGFVPLGSE